MLGSAHRRMRVRLLLLLLVLLVLLVLPGVKRSVQGKGGYRKRSPDWTSQSTRQQSAESLSTSPLLPSQFLNA